MKKLWYFCKKLVVCLPLRDPHLPGIRPPEKTVLLAAPIVLKLLRPRQLTQEHL